MNFLTLAKLSELIQNMTFDSIWMFINYIQIFLCGIVGLSLSLLSFSGTWLIFASAAIFKIFDQQNKISFTLLFIYLAICLITEVVEPFAAKYGITRSGGSKKSEIISILSGFIGALIGEVLIPIPFLGNILGMFLFMFFAIYCIEYRRLNCRHSSIKIAWAGVVSKVFMLMFKFLITTAMFIYLVSTVF
ncbi:MAG: DUF456 domain-containing protein [Fusobacteriaceae bacterium]|nr:DUF456 domain-containing protein [Fusobacteriaceae bacterium]MBP9509851.1 DUF456 domain-containing protein [Fusobacteriaceae bacterium]